LSTQCLPYTTPGPARNLSGTEEVLLAAWSQFGTEEVLLAAWSQFGTEEVLLAARSRSGMEDVLLPAQSQTGRFAGTPSPILKKRQSVLQKWEDGGTGLGSQG